MPLNAQITKQQAIDYVMDSIVGNQSDSVNVYMDSLVQTAAYYNLSPYDSIQSPYSNYWLFFIDEMPEYLWGHDCKYVFIDQTNGNNYTKQEQLPPFRFNFYMEEVSISLSLTKTQYDFSTNWTNQPQTEENCNLYAVLFLGYDYGPEYGYMWNALSHIYCGLLEQGYPEENIFVLSYDGTAGTETNVSLDLNNDGINDILEKECSVDNLRSIFEDDLKNSMKKGDMLFVYSFNHGVRNPFYENGATDLMMWNHEHLDDGDFALMIEGINCSQMVFNIFACHAGGLADDLESMDNDANKTIFTCTNWEQPYYRDINFFCPTTGMDEFNYLMISAYRGWYYEYDNYIAPWERLEPIGDHPDFSTLFNNLQEKNFDEVEGGNKDGIQQMNEIKKFVTEFDFYQFGLLGHKELNNGFQTDDLLSLHGISGKVETTQTLSGSFLIGGPFSVEPGVVLTLDNTVSFHVFDSEISIKPGINNTTENTNGGKLIVDGATLTNACSTPWKGIQVWGNADDDQFTYTGHAQPQGKLILEDAHIENADVAVRLYDYANDETTTGGIVYATGTDFKNNNRAISFKTYQNIHKVNNIEYDYQSSFKNCTFTIDNDFLHNTSTFEGTHIKMRGIKGVRIKGCTFENKLDVTPAGRAIHALDAGFVISGGCTVPNAQPCQNYINTSFFGFMHAIEASTIEKPMYQTYIRESDFENNGVGIYFSSVKNAVIVGNNFDLGWSPACDDDMGKGIYLDNSHSFAIEDNEFELTNPITNNVYVGIHTNNTNNTSDEIYDNRFNEIVYANYAEGKNWLDYQETGLAYYCNKNTGNNWDFYVTKLDDIEGDGIQKHQGTRYRVTGNEFSSSAYMHFDNNGDYWLNYYYDNSSTPETPDKLNRVEPMPIQLSNTCPDHYGGGNDIRLTTAEYSQRESDYSTALSSFNTALSAYESTRDSALQRLYSEQMSYYNMLFSRAVYNIVRSNMADTIVQDSLFAIWQENLDTYSSAETMVDYYLQQGDNTTALNKLDSLQYNFTFTSYDSTEYPYYSELKKLQIDWIDDGRDIFGLTTTEVSKLETIADSSLGSAGAQARAILSFTFDTTYFYTNCVTVPDTSQKSTQANNIVGAESKYLKVNISPNPAITFFNINYSINDGSDYAVLQIFSQGGRIIDKIILEKEEQLLQYNSSNLKPGIYYYSLSTTNNRETGKIVIVK